MWHPQKPWQCLAAVSPANAPLCCWAQLAARCTSVIGACPVRAISGSKRTRGGARQHFPSAAPSPWHAVAHGRAVHGHSHRYQGPQVTTGAGDTRGSLQGPRSLCCEPIAPTAEGGRAERGRPSRSAGRNAAPGRHFSAVCVNPNWARSTAGLLSASSCHRGHVLHVGEAELAYCVAWSQGGPKDKHVPVPAAFPVSCWLTGAFGAGGCRQSTECRWCSLAVSSAGCVIAVHFLSLLLLITTPAAPQAGWALLCLREG